MPRHIGNIDGDRDIVVCMRVGSMHGSPVRGADISHCHYCSLPIWISLATQAHVKQHDCDLVCIECSRETLANNPENITLMPGQLKEFLENLP